MPPQVIYEIGLGSVWDTDPSLITWYDLTDRVRDQARTSVRRLRQKTTFQIQSGEASFRLDNRDGALNPLNSLGMYYSLGMASIRGTPFRIRAFYKGIEYGVFYGFVTQWDQQDDMDPADLLVDVTVSDAFERLGRETFSRSYVSQASGARVTAILDQIGWPSALREIDTGDSTLQAVAATGEESALKHLQRVAESEAGLLFVSGSGKITFQGRNYRSQSPQNEVKGFFGRPPGYRIRRVRLPLNLNTLGNVCYVQREGGTEQEAVNDVSVAQHGRRELPAYRGLWISTDDESAARAAWEVWRSSDEEPTIDGLTVPGTDDEGSFEQLLAREFGDRINVTKTLPGDDYNADHIIESISHDWTEKGSDWATTWTCSPARWWTFWTLDESDLNVDAVLGY